MIAPQLLQLPECGRCADARQMPASDDPQNALRGPPEWRQCIGISPAKPESGRAEFETRRLRKGGRRS
jgi:hypothetical protein